MSQSQTQEPVLDIRNLSVELPGGADRAFAIEDVSLAVSPREVVCVVGESGSGKSVTSHAIMGLLPSELKPVGGAIIVDNTDILRSSRAQLRDMRGSRVSMIFQEPMTALNPVMRVGEQIGEVLKAHTEISRQERIRRSMEVIREVGLPDAEVIYHQYPHQLSGGQRQRIMIAAALVLEPKLLIADEPTTALDVTTQARILRIISDIQKSHETGVLFITHDIGVVSEIADRVVVMQSGRIVEKGSAERVLYDPQEEYTKTLISSVPSLLPGKRNARSAPQTALRVEGLFKTHRANTFFGKRRNVPAVRNVSFNLNNGEVLGIVGESGSGKTTVARCVGRLTKIDGGVISFDNKNLATVSDRQMRSLRPQIQMIFQDPYRSLNPRRLVGASIIEGPIEHGLSYKDAKRRALEVLKRVKLEPVAFDRYPHQFSGGQRQRICIARALAMEPKILVADEIVSALDVTVQKEILVLLNEIRAAMELSIIFITHDLRVAAQLCDSIAVMHRGEIVEMGDCRDVFGEPKHEYTRTLIGAVPGKALSRNQDQFMSRA